MSIRNDAAEEAVRKLASFTKEGFTETIRISVEERYQRLRRARAGRSLKQELFEIAQRCANRPEAARIGDDEVLGYDEGGAPTK